MKRILLLSASAVLLASSLLFSGESRFKTKADIPAWLSKQQSSSDRKYFLMNGNQIVGNIYNYGGIAPGLGLLRHVNNMVWHGLGDLYQFGPLVAASVRDTLGNLVRISSDAINDVYAKDVNPLNNSEIYGWEPLPEYADPGSPVMASSSALDINPRDGKPDSWPSNWYNPQKGQYVWPGYLRQDVPNADLEVLWGMDDRDNREFGYYPFYGDAVRRGLGVKVEGRALQWSNALAQNTIFFIYTVQNYSPRDLDTVFFGMYGDVDVGGGWPIGNSTAESQDDLGYFISPFDLTDRLTGKFVPVYSRSLVYLWDKDGIGNYGLRTHYDACKFLESPGNPTDGINNDGDFTKAGVPMIDESQTNGIDDDGDWNVKNDDVGMDGIPGTNDEGEGDGIPTRGHILPDGTLDPLLPGEPNFELTDLHESDQIGLTAFTSWTWGDANYSLSVDSLTWKHLDAGFNDTIPQGTDISFLYGSGKMSLKRANSDGSIKRFSIALIMGWTKDDIILTAQTVQVIYDQNYQFIRPPDKPTVTAVPGDRKVTLYWDNAAENSIDPIQGKDFEGYVIYRSTDPQFSDIYLITDGTGNPLLSKPLQDLNGKNAKWDVAFRPEPFVDSGKVGSIYDLTLKRSYMDLNGNNKWDPVVDDYWKGYSPMPYDQRGVSYYLGDNTGLVHSYVDSNNVINGQTYYYAVVSYDHGDSIQYSPSECTKRISIDPITSQLTFDVNTVKVTPGPRVNGFKDAGFASSNSIDRISGNATGTVSVKILDDLAMKDGWEYSLIFADSITSGATKQAQLNYSVLRLTPVRVEVSLFDTNFVKLGASNISKDSVLVIKNSTTGVVYVEGTDFVIDYGRGLIRKTKAGAMGTINGPFNVTYRSYGAFASTLLQNEESNSVFDGVKPFVQNMKLEADTINSRFINAPQTNFVIVVDNLGIGNVPLKRAPIDVGVRFNSMEIYTSGADSGKYKFPGDTLKDATTNVKVVTPFHVYNATDTTTLTVYINDVVGVKGKWDPSDKIIVLTPKPYSAVTSIMMRIIFSDPLDLTKRINIQGGETFIAKMSQPFTSKDVYQFTTVSAKFDPLKAASALDKIKVVPNPYIATNDIEPTDRLPGTTRGSRRLYFEHLPTDATIRIFTLSGELVKTLEHHSGLDNGREYWDLLNRDNLGVAYGVYIAHIDAPNVGERIIKFALIK
jgi:hypothetical protein